MEKKIPISEWPSFIDTALKFPDKYLDLTKLKLRSSKKVLQNRLVEFSQEYSIIFLLIYLVFFFSH